MFVVRILIVGAAMFLILAGCSRSGAEAREDRAIELRLKQRALYEKHFLERSLLSAEQIQELASIHSNVLQTSQIG